MKKIIQNNIFFYLPFAIWCIVLSVYILISPKGELTLWMNDQHTAAGDFFFKIITWMGDGLVVAFICVVLLFVEFRAAVFASIVSIANMIITALLKQYFNYPRPAAYFNDVHLNFVEGVKTYYHFSFPSGHTSAAFSIYLVLAILNQKKKTGLFFFALAAAIAISRVYLLQHFVEDVLFGSLLAVILTTIIAAMIYKKTSSTESKWNKSLLRLRR